LDSNRVAWIFPGQASQYVGMAADLESDFHLARELFERAEEILGLNLREVCFNGPNELLVQTQYTQPAIFVHSSILDSIMRERGLSCDLLAGHSLGEYSTLVSSGALEFESALRAVKHRSQFMQEACDRNRGTMAAVVGMELEEVQRVLEGIDGVVTSANYNSPGQVAISGEVEAVGKAGELLAAAGAKRVIPLKVGGAYHSPLMRPARERMEKVLKDLEFRDFSTPVIANVSAEPVTEGETMRELLSAQITSPVLWYPSVKRMIEMGVTTFVEVGPGKVLQGLVKRSLPGSDAERKTEGEIRILGVDRSKDIEALERLRRV
jgi:[acyl-carrier-protein] S-malonyltransferase